MNDIEQKRAQAILQILLDGAEPWDVREYVAQKEQAAEGPWTVLEGGQPLTAEQIGVIAQAADALITATYPDDAPEVARHKAKLKNLYARAVSAGEIGTAARILRDIADFDKIGEDDEQPDSLTDLDLSLLLEIQRLHLEIANDRNPQPGWTARMEHGPLWSPAKWFDECDSAQKKRLGRAMVDLADDGFVVLSKAPGAKCCNVRLTEAGVNVIEQFAANQKEE